MSHALKSGFYSEQALQALLFICHLNDLHLQAVCTNRGQAVIPSLLHQEVQQTE